MYILMRTHIAQKNIACSLGRDDGIWHMLIWHCIAEGHSVGQHATRTEGKERGY